MSYRGIPSMESYKWISVDVTRELDKNERFSFSGESVITLAIL